MTNTLEVRLQIINSYPWTRISVRKIGAIKRQFFHMVTHVFDNSSLSQESFAIDTWRAVTQGVPKNLLESGGRTQNPYSGYI